MVGLVIGCVNFTESSELIVSKSPFDTQSKYPKFLQFSSVSICLGAMACLQNLNQGVHLGTTDFAEVAWEAQPKVSVWKK